jgi:cytoplasmic iron level regulating protein YaaA (DUF328/UPF0246 family)
MSRLLVQSCSKSKIQASESVQALDLYSGYFYKIIKKSIREDQLVEDLDLSILSAKHGLLDPDQAIEPYDERMTTERADSMADEVTASLRSTITEGDYERVIINAGKTYRRAVQTEELPATVSYISGDGIGAKGQALKQFIRGDDSVLEEAP